jgi:hypothetical protein
LSAAGELCYRFKTGLVAAGESWQNLVADITTAHTGRIGPLTERGKKEFFAYRAVRGLIRRIAINR